MKRAHAPCGSLRPNPSLQPTCYDWLRQPPQAAELNRWEALAAALKSTEPPADT